MPAIRPGIRMRRSRKGASAFAPRQTLQDRLSDLPATTNNPGKLRGRYYVPKGLKPGAALVVVLHGCTQNAAVYDQGSGWSKLADQHGFALLFPEQERANNPMLCFNWFQDGDIRRGQGEAASIAQFVAAMCAAHAIDERRIYVTGLSAGGAMASVMLATYPELFSAGAIIAGVAYGCASGVAQAFDCMGGRASTDARALGAKVRTAAAGHAGPWPRVQVWQGDADVTVAPGNADSIVLQWADLHGLPPQPTRADTVDGHPRRVWERPGAPPLIEQYMIAGMAHGIPLDPGTGEGQLGEAGAHMLDVGLSSTHRIAEFFGIAAAAARAEPRGKPAAAPRQPVKLELAKPAKPKAAGGVQQVIEDALRKAGLMR